MDKQLTATVDNGLGHKENHQGTREEIESWLEIHLDANLVSVVITDETGFTVGRKFFGMTEITWACKFSEE